ncbi:DUF5344 family protein [Bacillus sp. CGMCC 1.16541]|uniref:DUF5344 family protein n=1 Tax=Bacillus sp. CGMCC 1.16541 TaxID=2185143 RepID=UPI000D7357A4|nr:DUF5344 family protein [Bacillus sp. CGMCC 1.16541]
MGQEIRVQYDEVREVLQQLQAVTQSLDVALPNNVSSQNVLETMNSLHEINEALGHMLVAYQTLVLKSVERTSNSVDQLQETDNLLAKAIK